jgi:pyruvate dehydrogenase kinase 2/3/4
MRLRLRGQQREVSERRQVGDAEEMLRANEETKGAWWRNVSMEEGM